jgi:hypothetical protein
MKNTTCRKEVAIAAVALLLICGIVISEWVMVRFVHFHSQNSILDPADYDAEVIRADDYKILADPNMPTVTLSTGKTIMNRSDFWYRGVFPKYKPANNSGQYVLVTTKGTAHFARRWDAMMIMILPLALIGLVCAARVCKKSTVL